MFKWLKRIFNLQSETTHDKFTDYLDKKFPNKLIADVEINTATLQSILSVIPKQEFINLPFVRYVPHQLNRPLAKNGTPLRTKTKALDDILDITIPPKAEKYLIIANEFNKYFKR